MNQRLSVLGDGLSRMPSGPSQVFSSHKTCFYLSMTHRGTAKSAQVVKPGSLLTPAILSPPLKGAFWRTKSTNMAVLDLFSSSSAPAAKPSSKVCTEPDSLECVTKAQILQAVGELLLCPLDQVLC